MAQLGSAQREPSMEEILASIRRIIEDSDTVRRPEDSGQPVRPDNDVSPSPSTAAAVPQEGAVIEVDAFRSAGRGEADRLETRKAVALSEVPTRVSAEKAAASETDGHEHEPSPSLGAAARPAPPEAEPAAVGAASASLSPEGPAATDWRLGVSEPEAIEAVEHDDFDLDEVANAVMQDIADAQSNHAATGEIADAAQAVGEPVRPSIISDRTGRQVAASFSELSEALAARNRKSLDEMAEEMLRPMLQDWLDNNLPTLVERLVREEIERVARGSN